jgi:3-oxoacyl-[acyl-carrier-protein] synthase-3
MGFDIRSGCAGFGTAMVAACQFLATGMAQRALVVGADLLSSRYLPYFASGKPDLPLEALFNLMFFGDGAGALVLEACSEGGMLGMTMGSDRPRLPFGSVIAIGGSRHPYPTPDVPREHWPIAQDGPLTRKTVTAVAVEAISRFLRKHRLQMKDFDHAVLPIVHEEMEGEFLAAFPGIAERVVSIGPEGGALINAAVPLSLDKGVREGRIRPGHKVLVYAAENTRWQHAVLGLVWDACDG